MWEIKHFSFKSTFQGKCIKLYISLLLRICGSTQAFMLLLYNTYACWSMLHNTGASVLWVKNQHTRFSLINCNDIRLRAGVHWLTPENELEYTRDKETRAGCQWPQLLLIQLLAAAHVQPPPSTCLQNSQGYCCHKI